MTDCISSEIVTTYSVLTKISPFLLIVAASDFLELVKPPKQREWKQSPDRRWFRSGLRLHIFPFWHSSETFYKNWVDYPSLLMYFSWQWTCSGCNYAPHKRIPHVDMLTHLLEPTRVDKSESVVQVRYDGSWCSYQRNGSQKAPLSHSSFLGLNHVV